MGGTWRRAVVALLVVLVAATGTFATAFGPGSDPGWSPAQIGEVQTCGPEVIQLDGVVTPGAEGDYLLVPFEVPEGTARVEVGYDFGSSERGVLDLGLWDSDGTSGPDAFRFWSGSRQGRLDRGMEPVAVAPDRNERTVVADSIEPGIWHVELGVASLLGPTVWTVEIRCPSGDRAEPLVPDRVDAGLVVRDEPGWYAADFQMHAYHSSPDGPDEQEMVELARGAGLDIIAVTEYVTPAHWDRLGEAQRDNPDVLLWPGREVVTYDGHFVVLGETPDSIEYRLGFEDAELGSIELGDIQRAAAGEGALVSLAHPTLFPPETFGDACRGCFLEAIDQVDWESTHLIEVVTEGVLADIGGSEVPNPFVDTAVALWEEQLRTGNRLTAVSGSDDKEGDRYGSTMTMVWADQLSRAAVDAALRSGHAYVRGLGAQSPTIEVTAAAKDGGDPIALMGDTLVAEEAEMTVEVTGGSGQMLALRRDGTEVERVPISGDEFTQTFDITRDEASGPLGTFYGIEVLDSDTYPGAELRTVIANPVFLGYMPPDPLPGGEPAGYYGEEAGLQDVGDGIHDEGAENGPRTNGGTWPVIVLLAALLGLGIGGFVIARRLFPTDPPPEE